MKFDEAIIEASEEAICEDIVSEMIGKLENGPFDIYMGQSYMCETLFQNKYTFEQIRKSLNKLLIDNKAYIKSDRIYLNK